MHRSELRQDLVSGDWIVLAPRRGARPHEFFSSGARKRAPKRDCPFEASAVRGRRPMLEYGTGSASWTLRVIANKFPAFIHRAACPTFVRHGVYTVAEGVGHHDIVVTRHHDRNFADLSERRAREVFQAFRDRYAMLAEDQCVKYVSMFQNWGPEAGASVYHPPYQIIAIPFVPPNVDHSIQGSRLYFSRHKTCVHCAIITAERKARKRVVYENETAVAFVPFASRVPFELGVFPKRHTPFFENSPDRSLDGIAETLQRALAALKRALKDPDYNFFIHTSPLPSKNRYLHYHGHIEVLPKLSKFAGFELGTGLEINSVDPDKAARILRAAARR